MIRVKMIDHIVLRTQNLERMLDFYSRVLGCPVERRLPTHVGLTQLRAGQSLIDLVDVDSELGRAGGPPPRASKADRAPSTMAMGMIQMIRNAVVTRSSRSG